MPGVLAAVVTLGVFIWLTGHVAVFFGGNWTALFMHGDQYGVPAGIAGGSYVFPNSSGYDGQFYRMMAHDPFFSKGYAAFMDEPAVRSRRILLPALSWVLALGQERWIDAAYIALNLAAVFAGVFYSARWLAAAGCSQLWALGFMILPGTIASLERMVVDSFFTGLFAAYLWFARKECWRALWLCAACLCLTKEPGFLCAAGVAAWLAMRREWAGAAKFATAAIPGILWYAYSSWLFGPQRFEKGMVGFPVTAALRRVVTKWGEWRGLSPSHAAEWLSIVCFIATLGLAVWWLAKRWGTWTAEMPALAMMTVLYCILAGVPGFMVEPLAFGRTLSPWLLALFLNGVAERRWLMAGSALAVGVGTLSYWKVSVQKIAASILWR